MLRHKIAAIELVKLETSTSTGNCKFSRVITFEMVE